MLARQARQISTQQTLLNDQKTATAGLRELAREGIGGRAGKGRAGKGREGKGRDGVTK